jgi:hypothetical protein
MPHSVATGDDSRALLSLLQQQQQQTPAAGGGAARKDARRFFVPKRLVSQLIYGGAVPAEPGGAPTLLATAAEEGAAQISPGEQGGSAAGAANATAGAAGATDAADATAACAAEPGDAIASANPAASHLALMAELDAVAPSSLTDIMAAQAAAPWGSGAGAAALAARGVGAALTAAELCNIDPATMESTRAMVAAESSRGAGDAGLRPAERALLRAAREGDAAALLEVLGADESVDVNAREPRHGATALHYVGSRVSWVTDGRANATAAAAAAAAAAAPGAEAGAGVSEESLANHCDEALAMRTTIGALVGAGAEINAPAFNGSTALHWASGSGSAMGVAALLGAGADPRIRSHTWNRQVFGKGSGQTPAHWAAESGYTEIALSLLGEDPPGVLAVDERGQMPKELARKELHGNTLDALEELEREEFVCVEFEVEQVAHRPLGWLG